MAQAWRRPRRRGFWGTPVRPLGVSIGVTGEMGDGRVFVLPVDASYRIRTGEREI